MLMSKEVELETSKKRIAELEEELKMKHLQPEASGDAQYSMLHDKIEMLNEQILSKEKTIEEKEKEIAALMQAKDSASLYSRFRRQLSQSNELLARKETELLEKNKEVLDLKSELVLLQAEYRIKEQELKELRLQQKNTLDDLSKVVNLNISLQQNTQEYIPGTSGSEGEKQKADELKKELEELLGK